MSQGGTDLLGLLACKGLVVGEGVQQVGQVSQQVQSHQLGSLLIAHTHLPLRHLQPEKTDFGICTRSFAVLGYDQQKTLDGKDMALRQ